MPEFHHGLRDLFENQQCLKTAFILPSPLPDSISPLIYFPFYYILETTVLSGILVTQRTADNYLLKQRLPQKRRGEGPLLFPISKWTKVDLQLVYGDTSRLHSKRRSGTGCNGLIKAPAALRYEECYEEPRLSLVPAHFCVSDALSPPKRGNYCIYNEAKRCFSQQEFFLGKLQTTFDRSCTLSLLLLMHSATWLCSEQSQRALQADDPEGEHPQSRT